MPKVFECKKCKFFFFSNEGTPPEPCHIHVRRGECLCKFWILDKAVLAENFGFSPETLNELRKVADKNIKKIKEEIKSPQQIVSDFLLSRIFCSTKSKKLNKKFLRIYVLSHFIAKARKFFF